MSTGFRYKDIAYMYDAIGRKPNPKDLTHTQSTLLKYMYIYEQVFLCRGATSVTGTLVATKTY